MTGYDRRTVTLALAGGFAAFAGSGAAANPAPPDSTFDVRTIVAAAAAILRREYVDEVEAYRLADLLLANLAAGKYAAAHTPRTLATKLTDDLRAATNDLHMNVFYDPKTPDAEAPQDIAEDDLHPRYTGWGVQTVARLGGNIGLIRVTHFPSPPEKFASRYGAAMDLLSDTAALIVDLTVNHGGGGDTAAYFLSYFLDGEVVLGRALSRHEPPEVTRTYKTVLGLRYGEARPIYVAQSHATFSAGEMLAAKFKELRHATLVGRQTRGGAHMGEFFKLPFELQMFVVTGRGEGRDWEGVGIAPDVPCEPEFAVATAHRLALEGLLRTTADAKQQQVMRNVAAHSTENLSSFTL